MANHRDHSCRPDRHGEDRRGKCRGAMGHLGRRLAPVVLTVGKHHDPRHGPAPGFIEHLGDRAAQVRHRSAGIHRFGQTLRRQHSPPGDAARPRTIRTARRSCPPAACPTPPARSGRRFRQLDAADAVQRLADHGVHASLDNLEAGGLRDPRGLVGLGERAPPAGACWPSHRTAPPRFGRFSH